MIKRLIVGSLGRRARGLAWGALSLTLFPLSSCGYRPALSTKLHDPTQCISSLEVHARGSIPGTRERLERALTTALLQRSLWCQASATGLQLELSLNTLERTPVLHEVRPSSTSHEVLWSLRYDGQVRLRGSSERRSVDRAWTDSVLLPVPAGAVGALGAQVLSQDWAIQERHLQELAERLVTFLFQTF